MKQITPEIKQRIFALYWGQRVCRAVYPHEGEHIDKVGQWNIHHITNLELSPLSSITDEDAAQCGYSTCDDPNSGNYSMSPAGVLFDEIVASNRYDMLNIYDADYLRSKGYALPAFGYSVDELVGAGVFKIKEVNND